MQNEYVYFTIEQQRAALLEIVRKNPNLKTILGCLEFPNGFPWYVAAGCVNQTVWNYLTGREITSGIGDYDLVYWDDDISKDAELEVQGQVMSQLSSLGIKLDVVNEARVPVWFEEDFGEKIEPYVNLEHAISTWPATVTCAGITKKEGGFHVVAPYGLNDLFSMTLRPNMPSVIMDVFEDKANKWVSKWPELTVVTPG
jgi:uncharacterized protein